MAGDGAIDALAETVSDLEIGIAMARGRLLDAPTLLNTRGNVVHAAGFAWVGGLGEPVETAEELADVPSASGAALASGPRRSERSADSRTSSSSTARTSNSAWRARLQGLRVVMDPRADAFHDYEFTRNDTKRYFLECNRLVFVLPRSRRGSLPCSPLLVAAEVAVSLLALKEGWLKEKARGWAWCLRHLGWSGATGARRRRSAASPSGELRPSSPRPSTLRRSRFPPSSGPRTACSVSTGGSPAEPCEPPQRVSRPPSPRSAARSPSASQRSSRCA